MRTFLSLLLAVVVVALGAWAYRENYATQAAMAEAEALETRIAEARARLAVLRAEWAYLNRPDRLNDLAVINFDRLGLLPLAPEQFGLIEEIPYPTLNGLLTPDALADAITGVLTGVVDLNAAPTEGDVP